MGHHERRGRGEAQRRGHREGVEGRRRRQERHRPATRERRLRLPVHPDEGEVDEGQTVPSRTRLPYAGNNLWDELQAHGTMPWAVSFPPWLVPRMKHHFFSS